MTTSPIRLFVIGISLLALPLAGNLRASSPADILALPQPTASATPTTLWYNGDFDGTHALSNENDTRIPFTMVFDDFIITDPAGWDLTGVFSNNLTNTNIVDVYFFVTKDVSEGDGGPGTGLGGYLSDFTKTPTGRKMYGLPEYRIEAKFEPFHLAPGHYWLTVVPRGDGTGRSFITGTVGANAIGTPPGNNGMAYITSFSDDFYYFTPTTIVPNGFTDYSMGVIGTVTPDVGPLALVGVASLKEHGDLGFFSIDLPLDGSGVEDRRPLLNDELIATFNQPIVGLDDLYATCGDLQETASALISPQQGDTEVAIFYNSKPCAGKPVTITLLGLKARSGNTVDQLDFSLKVMPGDVDGDGTVTAADEATCRALLGQTVTPDNFRCDLSLDGQIDSKDVHVIHSFIGRDK